MEKRTIAAIALSIAVLFLFRYFQEKKMAEIPKNQPAAKMEPAIPAPPPAPAEASTVRQPARPAEKPPVAASTTDTVAVPRRIVIDSDLYRAELDNRGGLLKSWTLKSFKTARGQVFDMIPVSQTGDPMAHPGSLEFDDGATGAAVNGEAYAMDISGTPRADGAYETPVRVTLTLMRGNLSARKTYSFEKGNYIVGYEVSVERDGRPVGGKLLLGQDIGPEIEHLLNPSAPLEAVSSEAGKVTRNTPPGDDKEVKRVAGNLQWIGLNMQYFALIAIPESPVALYEIQKRVEKARGLDGNEVSRDLLQVAVPGSGVWKNRLYVGPKQQSALEAVSAVDLTGVIDYGMFSFIVRPLLWGLKYIVRVVPNYGLSIIILTLLLTLLLFPFRLKQMLSMKKMAVVQPKIKAIQEKYKKYKKTDPKRSEMNQEVMAAYKEHNVNPLGGCLPLLLQMPLLFAFYQLLAASIELRQAPFFGWIHDLSIKDPYYVLPIIMGVTMFISQKMTPMTPGADPTQAKMMMMMPAVFTLMFLNVSAGLNLYFLCSNIFQIAFQKITERWIGDGGTTEKQRA